MRKTRLLLSVVLLTIGISATKAAPEVETVTIGSTGYATYCSSNALYIDGVPEPIGRWTFDDGTTGTLTKTPGVTVAGCVATVPAGDNLKVTHGITDRGNYTFMMDVKIVNEEKSNYTSLFMSGDGREDGGLFFFHDSQNGTRKIGINLGHMGYDGSYELNTWYRVVFSCKDYIPTVYVDGEKVVAATQAVNPTRLHWTLGDVIYFFADNDGEENIVQTSEIRLWDVALDEYQVAKLGLMVPEALGTWTFDDTSNLLANSSSGGTATLQATKHAKNNVMITDLATAGITTVTGPDASNGAVNIPISSSLKMTANNGTSSIGTYSVMFDICPDDVSGYNSLWQNDINNNKDASLFIYNGRIGLAGTLGYQGQINAGQWYRVVFVVESTDGVYGRGTLYVDGKLISTFEQTASTLSGNRAYTDHWKLYSPGALFFADESNGGSEEKNTKVSELRFWDLALTAAQVAQLATVGTTTYDGPVAYTGKIVSGGLSLTELSGGIPANTAVVLKGTPNTAYRFVVMPTGLPAVTDNDLRGSDGSIKGGEGIYALAIKNDKVGFYPVAASVTIPAGKAYLVYTGSNPVKGFTFVFDDDDATGIEEVQEVQEVQGAIYNLAGQRVSKMQKGINIVNGKKVLK